MQELGPLWQLAEYNAYYYASFWIAPCLIGIGVMSSRTRGFLAVLLLAVFTTFVVTWLAHNQMWSTRAALAENPAQKAILDLYLQHPIRSASLYATLQTLRITVVWGFGGVLFRWGRKWIDKFKDKSDQSPFEVLDS